MKRIALVAPTQADVRDVMVEGESGIISVCPPWNKPKYEPSKRRLVWPDGQIAFMYSSEEPNRLRGPQHEKAWCDELAAWKRRETWDMLQFGMRLGNEPQNCVTTTPKPDLLLKSILQDSYTKITRGSTRDNVDNLAPGFIEEILRKYRGTRLERQEVEGEYLDKIEGALWSGDFLRTDLIPELQKVVVAIDPAASTKEESAETGIIVAGISEDVDGTPLGYVLEDLSGKYSPIEWAKIAVDAYHRWKAAKILAEANHGGDMVESNVRQVDSIIPFQKVFASRGKRARAEPVATLYEQRRITHIGEFDILEDQMLVYNPDEPKDLLDRVDALVWAFSDLIVNQAEVRVRFL